VRKTFGIIPLLLSGCAATIPLSQERTLVLYPHFEGKSQSLVVINSLASIATLDIIPYIEVTSGSYAPISAASGEPHPSGPQTCSS
jgi:hypothetical protein